MFMSNKAYDVIKHIVQVVLPALGALYFTLSEIYDWSNGAQVVGTISAIALFLGVSLGLSSRAYKAQDPGFDGALHIHREDGLPILQLEFENEEQAALVSSKDRVVLNVKDEDKDFWGNDPFAG